MAVTSCMSKGLSWASWGNSLSSPASWFRTVLAHHTHTVTPQGPLGTDSSVPNRDTPREDKKRKAMKKREAPDPRRTASATALLRNTLLSSVPQDKGWSTVIRPAPLLQPQRPKAVAAGLLPRHHISDQILRWRRKIRWRWKHPHPFLWEARGHFTSSFAQPSGWARELLSQKILQPVRERLGFRVWKP